MIKNNFGAGANTEAYGVTDRNPEKVTRFLGLAREPLRTLFSETMKPLLIAGSSRFCSEAPYLHSQGLLPAGSIPIDLTLGIPVADIKNGKWLLLDYPVDTLAMTVQNLAYIRSIDGKRIDPHDVFSRVGLEENIRQGMKGGLHRDEFEERKRLQLRTTAYNPGEAAIVHQKRLEMINTLWQTGLVTEIISKRVPDIPLDNHKVGNVIDYYGPYFALEDLEEQQAYLHELLRVTDHKGRILIAGKKGSGIPNVDIEGWNVNSCADCDDDTMVINIGHIPVSGRHRK